MKQVRQTFCKTLDDMCTDWTGRSIKYSIQFECLKPDCMNRYPLEICNSTEEVHPCGAHNIKLNDVRDMFGELHNVPSNKQNKNSKRTRTSWTAYFSKYSLKSNEYKGMKYN